MSPLKNVSNFETLQAVEATRTERQKIVMGELSTGFVTLAQVSWSPPCAGRTALFTT